MPHCTVLTFIILKCSETKIVYRLITEQFSPFIRWLVVLPSHNYQSIVCVLILFWSILKVRWRMTTTINHGGRWRLPLHWLSALRGLQFVFPNTVNQYSVWQSRSTEQREGFCVFMCNLHIHIHSPCHVLISTLHSRDWPLRSHVPFALTGVITFTKSALSRLKLGRNPPRLHSCLQVR